MLCRIADLYVQVPEVGDLPARCEAYITKEDRPADIVIREADFEPQRWEGCDHNMICYMESARLFYWDILRLGGMMLHSAAVEYEGVAYLFSGPSTVGKSTHTRLWREVFGEGVQFFNDDKPALRFVSFPGWSRMVSPSVLRKSGGFGRPVTGKPSGLWCRKQLSHI